MHHPSLPANTDPSSLAADIAALIADERDWLANLANATAWIFGCLPRLNWAGCYRWHDGALVLGPFQGRPACVRMALGRGVCGTAAAQRTTIVVPDTHVFPGHIACDPASKSELVVPLLDDDRLLGVLDLDSPDCGRFSDAEASALEAVAKVLVAGCDWPDGA